MKTKPYVCINENNIDMKREKYESLLPYGYKAVVAERAGCSRQTVSAFFTGKTNSKKVEDAILDVVAELKEQKESKMKKAGLI